MGRFDKYLSTNESLRRYGGMSPFAPATDGVALASLVLFFWLLTRLFLRLSKGSPLGQAFDPLSRTLYALLTALLAIVAVVVLLRLVVRAGLRRYALTDSRVLVGSLLWTRAVDLAEVRDAVIAQNAPGKLFDYGDIIVRTSMSQNPLRLRSVAQPHQWYRELHELVCRAQNPTPVASELAKLASLREAGALSDVDWERAKGLFLGGRADKQAEAIHHLKQLHELRRSGVLSESEFNMKKWDVLSRTA